MRFGRGYALASGVIASPGMWCRCQVPRTRERLRLETTLDRETALAARCWRATIERNAEEICDAAVECSGCNRSFVRRLGRGALPLELIWRRGARHRHLPQATCICRCRSSVGGNAPFDVDAAAGQRSAQLSVHGSRQSSASGRGDRIRSCIARESVRCGVERPEKRWEPSTNQSFRPAVELVILMHEKLLRHFDPDIAAKRAQVSLRIVQERACQGTGETPTARASASRLKDSA